MFGALIAVCHWYGVESDVRAHLQKATVLVIASAWVCFPALIMFDDANARYFPVFLFAGMVLMRAWLLGVPFFMSACGLSCFVAVRTMTGRVP
jgi:hypothetical protein